METPDIGKMIEEETARRLEIMLAPGYGFPPSAGAWNYWAIGAIVAASATLIILCMAGVIQ